MNPLRNFDPDPDVDPRLKLVLCGDGKVRVE
jgi:hypothetical protein